VAWIRLVAVALALVVVACSGSTSDTPAATARPVAVDTDLGADDLVALAYLSQRPEIEIVAVTVSGTGLARCEAGVANARAVLAELGAPDVPVACGPERPMSGGPNRFPEPWRDASDALYGLDLPASDQSSDDSAPSVLAEAMADGATVLALGPLTNLAAALDVDPSGAARAHHVYAMAGAVSVPGNVVLDGNWSPAEWNVYADPAAADAVIRAGLPLTLVPLDATNHAPVDVFFADRLAAEAETDAARLVDDLLAANPTITAGGSYHWDGLAAAVLTDGGLARFAQQRVSVEKSGPEAGRTVPDPAGIPVRIATRADGARFATALIDTLNGRAGVPSDATPAPPPDVAGSITAGPTTCRWEAPAPDQNGRFTQTVEAREEAATIALAEVTGGHTIDDVRAVVAVGGDALPDWLSLVATYQAPPDAPFVVAPTLGLGRYAVGCVSASDGSVRIADGMLTAPTEAG
jgi:pyrimidine-specific ribonucleoside hydrolase